MTQKCFTILENNPEVMNHLANRLGLSKEVSFYDVYSLHDPELLALIPRPVYALLVIIPMTKTWKESREAEEPKETYNKSGPEEPVIWFKQTIDNACGSIGLLHCIYNSPHVVDKIVPGSILEKLLKDAIPLKMAERADVLYNSDDLEAAHQEAGQLGDTVAPNLEDGHRLGHHFVAFVKAKDGHLWELEGVRQGPIDRGLLAEDEDALSEKALELGFGRLIDLERQAGGDLRFSCIALAPTVD